MMAKRGDRDRPDPELVALKGHRTSDPSGNRHSESRSVFVTGATSGIGLATAGLLRETGFRVFGGVEPGEPTEALAATGADLVSLEVTDPSSLDAARREVEQRLGGGALWGLVNCAGVVAAGPVEMLDMREARRVFEVNVLGVLATSQTFLPMIREARGRIVNISSLSGLLAVPFLGSYNASKAAIESLCDTMRRELQHLGVAVIAVQPGATRTPMWDKAEAIDLGQYRGSAYEDAVDRVKRKAVRKGLKGQPPERVAEAIAYALTAEQPPSRIRVQRRRASRLFYSLLPLIPDRIIDRKVEEVVWK